MYGAQNEALLDDVGLFGWKVFCFQGVATENRWMGASKRNVKKFTLVYVMFTLVGVNVYIKFTWEIKWGAEVFKTGVIEVEEGGWSVGDGLEKDGKE